MKTKKMPRKDKRGRILQTGETYDAATGRYRYSAIDANGKRRQLYSWTLTANEKVPKGKRQPPGASLREKKAQFLADKANQMDAGGTNLTLFALCLQYVALKSPEVRRTTKTGYQTVLTLLKGDAFGKRRIRSITADQILLWFDDLYENHHKGFSSIHTIKAVLTPAFALAKKNRWILDNPCDFALSKKRYGGQKMRTAVSQEEMTKFLDFAEADPHFCQYFDGFFILFHTGLRISEFCGLTLEDIDFQHHILHVRRQLLRIYADGCLHYYIEDPKTANGIRDLPMSQDVERCFQRIFKKRKCPASEERIWNSAHTKAASGFLFLDKNHRVEVAQHWQSRMRSCVQKYNRTHADQISPITPHICRHTFCSNCAKSGISPKALQLLMGHSSIQFTLNVYTHLKLGDIRDELLAAFQTKHEYFYALKHDSEHNFGAKSKNLPLPDALDISQNAAILPQNPTYYNTKTDEDIQPTGEVKVTIPQVEGVDNTVAVHRINDDQTVTELTATLENVENAEVENAAKSEQASEAENAGDVADVAAAENAVETADVVFETEHFTPYVLTQNGQGDGYTIKIDQENSKNYLVTVSKDISVQTLKQILETDIPNHTNVEVVLEPEADVTWAVENAGWGPSILLDITGNRTIKIKGEGQNKLLRGTNCVGTMIRVHSDSKLTLENVTMDGSGCEYFGNGDAGWNGVGPDIKGVFIYNEGELTLNAGAVLTAAHTTSDQNGHTNELVKLAAPIFSQGGTVNINDGAKIHGNYFTGNITNGGNAYSAGAIIAAPSTDGSRRSTINMNGGEISTNKVGWDWNPNTPTKNLYRDESEMTSARTSGSLNGRGIAGADAFATPLNVKVTDHVDMRTPGVGAILLLGSDLNMSGGKIDGNYGEVGAIGVNGVGQQWDDLFVPNNKRDGNNGSTPITTWTDRTGLALSSEPSDENKRSTFLLTGGIINGNTGVADGGVYVGRFGQMIMGHKDAVEATEKALNDPTVSEEEAARLLAAANDYAGNAGSNGAIKITNNRSWANYGGAGIGLNSQYDDESDYWKEREQQSKDETGEPTFYMYGGTIDGNHSSNKAGGIYVATNDSHILGGVISNNKGDSHGGGIYVEAKFSATFANLTEVKNNTSDHTIAGFGDKDDNKGENKRTDGKDIPTEFQNAADDKARSALMHNNGYAYGFDGFSYGDSGIGGGGGLWLCPEGQSTFSNMGMLLVHDNKATKAGDDIYKVVAASFPNKGLIAMPALDPLGGKITWYRDGGVMLNTAALVASNANTWLVQQVNWDGSVRDPKEQYARFGSNGTDFKEEIEFTQQVSEYDAFAVKATYVNNNQNNCGDYVKLQIFGNKSARGGGIGSDGRLAFGLRETEETHELEIQKEWGNGTLRRPISINIYAQNPDDATDKRLITTVKLNRENGYRAMVKNLTSVNKIAGKNPIQLFETTYKSDKTVADQINAGTLKSTPTKNLVFEEVGADGYQVTLGKIEFKETIDNTLKETIEKGNGKFTQERILYTYKPLKIENESTNKKPVLIHKRTVEGTQLAGATLKIVAGDSAYGETIYDNWDTKNTAEQLVLMPGTYTLVEINAPEDYKIASPITFKVQEDGTVTYDGKPDGAAKNDVVMVDKPATMKVRVNKTWADDLTKVDVFFYLYSKPKGSNKEYEMVWGGDNPKELKAGDSWVEWKNLPVNKDYKVEEINPNGNSTFTPIITSTELTEKWGETKGWSKATSLRDGDSIIISRDEWINETNHTINYLRKNVNNETWASSKIISNLAQSELNEQGLPTNNVDRRGIWNVKALPDGSYMLINEVSGLKLTTGTAKSGALSEEELDYDPASGVKNPSDDAPKSFPNGDHVRYQDGIFTFGEYQLDWDDESNKAYGSNYFYAVANKKTGGDEFVVYRQIRDKESTYTINVTNTKAPTGKFEVKKVAAEKSTDVATSKTVLKDVKFKLYQKSEDGSITKKEVPALPEGTYKELKNVTTDAKGIAAFNDLLYGTYYLVETDAPKNYQMLTEAIEVKVGATTEIVGSVDFVQKGADNQILVGNSLKKGKLKIKKIDADNEKINLEGAEFKLWDENGKEVGAKRTGSNGLVEFTDLPYGTYTLRETKAPEGYVDVGGDQFEIKIDENGANFTTDIIFGMAQFEQISSNGVKENVLVVRNSKIPSYLLPITGGGGIAGLFRLGLLLVALFAAFAGAIAYKKRLDQLRAAK